MRASRILAVLAAVSTVAIVPRTAVFGAGAPDGPGLVVLPSAADVGALVLVTLERWPKGLATVSVCGNNALRGSPDCDLRTAEAVNVPDGGSLQLRVELVEPPVPCPCVIRVATTTSEVVRTIPIEVQGVPVSDTPLPPMTAVSGKAVSVKARLVETRRSWPESWLPPFAGPVRSTLFVSLHNTGSAPTPPLKLVSRVGRETGAGELLPARALGPLAPGERRTVSIPVELSVPAWGDYVVFGTVYGLDAPLSFEEETSNDPWAPELLAPLLLLVAAAVARRRERARRQRDAVGARRERDAAPLADCSPDVGVRAGERCTTPPYDPSQRKVAHTPELRTQLIGTSGSESMSTTRTRR